MTSTLRFAFVYVVVGLLATAVVQARPAHGRSTPPASPPDKTWTPRAVKWPVVPAQIQPTAGWTPVGIADTTHPVTVTPERAAVVWLGPAEIVRVRVLRGKPEALRLRRVTGSAGARLWIEEPGAPVDAGIQMIEPPGPGAIWVITARQPLRILVETARGRAPRLAWEVMRAELARWIADDGELPAIPGDEDQAMRLRLLGARSFVRSLGAVSAPVAHALRVWRWADVEAEVAVRRPSDDRYLERLRSVPPGEAIVDDDGATYGATPERWQVVVVGPGAIFVEARAERPSTGWDDSPGILEVVVDGELAARREESTDPVALSQERGALLAPRETQRLGRRLRAELAIGPGRHVVEISLTGLRWVRLEQRARRPRLRDPDLGAQIDEARARLGSDRSAAARVADDLLARVTHSRSAPGGRGPASPERLPEHAETYARLRSAPAVLAAEDATKHLASVTRLIADPDLDQSLREALVFELATRLPDTVAADPIGAIVVRWKHSAPAMLAVLAPRLRAGNPSDAVAAAQQAWRQAPSSELSQRAMLRVGRVAPLHRLAPRPAAPSSAPVASEWIAASSKVAAETTEGSLVELALGTPWTVEIPPARDPSRLAVIRVFAVTRPDQPGPIRIWLDEHVHTTIGLSAVERVELVAAPGSRTMRVEGPPGARVFVTAPGARGRQHAARREFHVADAGATTPRYMLPAVSSSAPIRVELRTRFVGHVTPRSIEAQLHSDAGASRKIVLESSDVDRATWPLTGDAQLSAVAATWVWMPPLTERVWITTDSPDLLVHVAVPRGISERDAAITSEPVPQPPIADPLAEVTAQSAILVASPDNADAYLARARALFEVGETSSARRDLAAAAALGVTEERLELVSQIAEMDRVDRAYLPAQPPGGAVVSGVALAPLPPAADDLAPAIELARTLRSRASIADPKLESEVGAVRWVRARVAEIKGRRHEAAVLWRGFGSWQADVAALLAMTSSPYPDPPVDAPVAYGLAVKLVAIEIPRLGRARMLAIRRSKWSAITNTALNAGTERLVLPASALAATRRGAIREALLAAPWSDGKLLDPGREASFSVKGPASVAVEIWCRRLWANPSDGRCQASARVDQHAPQTASAPYGQATRIAVLSVEAGRHQLTVALGKDDPQVVSAVRIIELSGATVVPSGTRVFLASSARPAEVVVAGPVTVGIEIRGFGRGEADARLARQAVVRLDGRGDTSSSVAVAPGLVAPGPADAVVTESVTHVVIVPEGVHRLAIQPDRGMLALRFARRVHAGVDSLEPASAPPNAGPSQASARGTGLPWPPLLGVPVRIAAEPGDRLVPSVDLVVGHETIEILDEEESRSLRVEVAAQIRFRTERSAALGELIGRQVGTRPPTGRVRLVGNASELRGGLTAHLELGAGVQRAPGVTAWRLDGRLSAQRPVRVGRGATLSPELGILGGALSSGPSSAATDPWVAGVYRRNHPIQWMARTSLRVRPFADQLALARIETRSNADLLGVDLVLAALAWQGLIELSPLRGPIGRLAYQPSYRFADDHRPVGYWRHEVVAEIAWGAPVRRGRLTWGLRAGVYAPSTIAGWEPSVGVSVRWDDARRGEPVRHGFESALADFEHQGTWHDAR